MVLDCALVRNTDRRAMGSSAAVAAAPSHTLKQHHAATANYLR
jgi:hypothetical protein